MVRRKYARRPSRPAVITGVTEHGDDFVLSVEKGEVGRDEVDDEVDEDEVRSDEVTTKVDA